MGTTPQEKTRKSEQFATEAEKHSPGLLGEFGGFLLHNKKWWLAPIIVVLLLVAALIVLTSSASFAPFIYTLF